MVDPLPEDAPYFVKDYHAHYETERGCHGRSGNSNDGWNVTGTMSFLNQPILSMAGEIDSPVLLVHGERPTRATSAREPSSFLWATTRSS